MVSALVAALERNNRRQSPGAPGLNGSDDHDDRDWARIKLDLVTIGSQQRWNRDHRNGPRPI
jgi:hypothetical protein